MVQLRGDSERAQRPLRAEGGGELRAEDLDGDSAVMLHVVGEEDDCHPAVAQLALDGMATAEGGPELRRDGAQVPPTAATPS